MKSAKELLADALEYLACLQEVLESELNTTKQDKYQPDLIFVDQVGTCLQLPQHNKHYIAQLKKRIITSKKHIETLEHLVELSELTKQFGHSAN